MKTCPFCAEDIQDAAIKCRFCGSMLTDPAAGASSSPADVDGVRPSPEVKATPGLRPAHIALSLVGVLLLVVLFWMLLNGGRGPGREAAGSAVSTAATLVPAAPTDGEYRFLDLQWGMPRAEVRTRLEARGFRFLERDPLGDEAYEGRVDGRDAGLDVRYVKDALARVSVILLPADPSGSVLMLTQQAIADVFGKPKEQRALATIWPERAGTLVWLTTSDERHVTVHFESAAWPAESRRRRAK